MRVDPRLGGAGCSLSFLGLREIELRCAFCRAGPSAPYFASHSVDDEGALIGSCGDLKTADLVVVLEGCPQGGCDDDSQGESDDYVLTRCLMIHFCFLCFDWFQD